MRQRFTVFLLSGTYAVRLEVNVMMRHRFTVFSFAIAFALGLGMAEARALQATDPSNLIGSMVDDALTVIKNQQISESDREQKFRSLLEQGFDIPRIARFVLGRYWAGANDQERQRFTTLFEDWIVHTYSARFTSYSGETVKITGARTESPISTVVQSQFVHPNNSGPPATVEWRVRKGNDGSFKVVDVAVEGVSMALTQRDEIAAVADRSGGTVAALNSTLEQKIQSGDTAPGGQPEQRSSR